MKQFKGYEAFLDKGILDEFRGIISQSEIFEHEQKEYYNLICAVMDRIETCVKYLNSHSAYPESEEEFITFTMFACMLIDAVKEILLQLDIISKNKGELFKFCEGGMERKYFGDVCKGQPLNLSGEDCPTDDKFFEYFRSLVFAHPVETNRAKFLKKGETQYSPWVIANKDISLRYDKFPCVGVRIYSNKRDDMNLRFPFQTLKDYISSRYMQLSRATAWAKNKCAEAEEEWRKQKINRSQPTVRVLKDIRDIVEARHWNSEDFYEIINYMECPLTCTENTQAVAAYRSAITMRLPQLCDAVESLDKKTVSKILDPILRCKPKGLQKGADYQLEKIFYELNDVHPNDIQWGRMQAQVFYNEFAKKWVKIVPDSMTFTEIKLLVCTACYLEKEAQEQDTL